jgi:hypothetical protein
MRRFPALTKTFLTPSFHVLEQRESGEWVPCFDPLGAVISRLRKSHYEAVSGEDRVILAEAINLCVERYNMPLASLVNPGPRGIAALIDAIQYLADSNELPSRFPMGEITAVIGATHQDPAVRAISLLAVALARVMEITPSDGWIDKVNASLGTNI